MWLESAGDFIVPSLCDLLTGFGLACILEFSTVSPDAGNFILVAAGSVLASLVVAYFTPCQKPPPGWLSFCNSTFSLLVSLSLSLNLISQLCPPTGREFALVPCYVLLCIARAPVTRLALLVQCALGLLVASAFLLLPASRHARPEGGESLMIGPSVSLAQALCLACLFGTFDTADKLALHHNKGGAAMAAVFIKGSLLLLLGVTRNTSLYHFMLEEENSVSRWLFVAYGWLLIFASMQTAAQWFGQLKVMLSKASARTLIRLQHIVYALLVACAWAYPLQLHVLRSIIIALLLAANLVFRWAG